MSSAAEPSVIVPDDPPSKVTLPTACMFPDADMSPSTKRLPNEPVDACEPLIFPDVIKLPVIGKPAMFAVKFNVSFPLVCSLTNL